jgi:hypothetical protein
MLMIKIHIAILNILLQLPDQQLFASCFRDKNRFPIFILNMLQLKFALFVWFLDMKAILKLLHNTKKAYFLTKLIETVSVRTHQKLSKIYFFAFYLQHVTLNRQYFIPKTTSSLMIHLSSFTNLKLEHGLFNDNKLNRLSINGTHEKWPDGKNSVEIGNDTFHGNYGPFPEIEITHAYSLILREQSLFGKNPFFYKRFIAAS